MSRQVWVGAVLGFLVATLLLALYRRSTPAAPEPSGAAAVGELDRTAVPMATQKVADPNRTLKVPRLRRQPYLEAFSTDAGR